MVTREKRSALLLAMVVLAATAVLWVTARAVTPQKATRADVLAEAQRGGYRIIELDALRQRYHADSGDLLLVDTRQGWEYRSGHIRGAVSFPMEPTWLSRWRKKGALQAFLGEDKQRSIVFY